MDVSHLAPALLSLSDVVKAANRLTNGEKSGVKILINADLDQKCFELDIELVLTAWEKAKQLISDDDIATAKQIAEWVGIISGPTIGLFSLIKWLHGNTIESTTEINIEDGSVGVEIRVEGESKPIEVSKIAFDLYTDVSTRRKAVEVLDPLRNDGYDSLQFYKNDDVFVEFGKGDIPEMGGSNLPEVVSQNSNISNIRAKVRIRKAAYEGASKWTLVYRRAIEAPIDDTEWLERFQAGQEFAPPGSSLDVDLKGIYITNENAEMVGEPSYRVVRVHGVVLPPEQLKFTRDDETSKLDE